MKAIVQDRYGSPDVLALQDVEMPPVADDEVLLRVHAAGVDPGVWHLMAGLPYLVRLMGYGVGRPKVRVPGTDVAGHVEAVGRRVTRFRRGDAVFGACSGSFAEFACGRETKLLPKPVRLTFEQAAAIPVSGLTALQAVRDAGAVKAGQSVLVIGAAGGVGTFAVQISAGLGARVTGVCSTGKMDLVRSLGAAHVIDYTREDCADGRHRYDVVFDLAGNRPLSRLRKALSSEGTLVIVGGEEGGRWFGGLERQLGAALLSPFVRQTLRPFFAAGRIEDLQSLAELVERGRLTPVIDRTYPLSEAPQAIRYLHEGHARGKVVIVV